MRTPPFDALLTTWRADPVTLVVLVAAAIAYALGIRRAARHGVVWPRRRTVLFFALGLGSYAVVELGFLGAWSAQLRWAFTARIALLLLAVPALIALGKPVELARAGMDEAGRDRLDGVLSGRTARILGNAMFLTLFTAAVFCVFLTPIVGVLRTSPVIGEAIGAVTVVAGTGWWPNPLHDQHLAGDLLWFIAEAADVPVLILLLLRWARRDRAEAADFGALTDAEHDALVQAHLRGARAGSDAAR